MYRILSSSSLAMLLVAGALVVGQGHAEPPDLRKQLDAAFQKGLALRQEGKTASAIPEFETALGLAPAVFGSDHVHTAGILSTLGAACLELNRYADAAKHLRNCLGRVDKSRVTWAALS
jgi:hypothetical protein